MNEVNGPRPWISIVIPSFNQAAYLERTIRSVFLAIETAKRERGLSSDDFEIWVQDGGSSDGSVVLLEEFRRAGLLDFRSEKDRGQAAALNTAIRDRARGEWIGWLNSDDLWNARALARLHEAVRSRPKVVWIHGDVEIIDQSDRVIRTAVTRYKNSRRAGLDMSGLLRENLISQMGAFFRKEAFLAVGGLDESLHYNMDYDLWLNFARKFGLPDIFPREREPVAYFRMIRGTKSMDGFWRQFSESYAVASGHRRAVIQLDPSVRDLLPSELTLQFTRIRICFAYQAMKWLGL